jgi:hypothetical protein
MGLSDFPTTVRLSRDMRGLVRREAKRQRRSVSWLMREIFDQWAVTLTCDKSKEKQEEPTSDGTQAPPHS